MLPEDGDFVQLPEGVEEGDGEFEEGVLGEEAGAGFGDRRVGWGAGAGERVGGGLADRAGGHCWEAGDGHGRERSSNVDPGWVSVLVVGWRLVRGLTLSSTVVAGRRDC